LRGHARSLPGAQALRRARRRLPALVRRPLGPRLPRPPEELRRGGAQEEADRVSEAALLRLARLHARGAAPPRRAGRRLAARDGYGLPVSLDADFGRPHPVDARAQRRRESRDPRRHRRAAARAEARLGYWITSSARERKSR